MIEFKITEATPLEALAVAAAFSNLILHSGEEIAAAAQALSTARLPERTGAPANPPAAAPASGASTLPTASLTPAPTPVPAPAATTAPAPPPAAPAMPAVPLAGAPTYTLEQMAHAGADFVMRNPGRQADATAVLAQFGVQSVTQLPKERYGEFATALRQIGAVI